MKSTSLIEDVLFYAQIGITIYYGFGQCRAITISTEGLSLVMFSSFLLSMFINLYLASTSENKQPRTIKIYRMWCITMISIVCFHLYFGSLQELDLENELTMLNYMGICSLIVVIIGLTKGWSIRHPYIKGGISAVLKSLPQLMLIPIIHNQGIEGWWIGSVVLGHITVDSRIFFIIKDIKKDGATKEHVSLLITEALNSLSWIAFTVEYIKLLWNLERLWSRFYTSSQNYLHSK